MLQGGRGAVHAQFAQPVDARLHGRTHAQPHAGRLVRHRGRGRRVGPFAGRRADPSVRLARHLSYQSAVGAGGSLAGQPPHPAGAATSARAQRVQPPARHGRAGDRQLRADRRQCLWLVLAPHRDGHRAGAGGGDPAGAARAAPRRSHPAARAVRNATLRGRERRGIPGQSGRLRPAVPDQPVSAAGARRGRVADRHPDGADAGDILDRQPGLGPHRGALECRPRCWAACPSPRY